MRDAAARYETTGTRAAARPRLVAALMVLTLVAFGTSACFVDPIDQPAASVAPTAHLRQGPQTALLPDADVTPVAVDPTPALPVTVDSLGHGRVTVTDAGRIVAVDQNGTLATIVFSLGLGTRVVGRDTSTAFPSAVHLPVVTNRGHSLNAEAVLAVRPTVLLVTDKTLPAGAVDQIRQSGIPVVVFTGTRDLAGNDALMRAVATALGVPAQGEALVARTDAQMRAAKAHVPSPSGAPVMAFIYVRGPYILYLLGKGTGADDLIDELGGRDAAEVLGNKEALTQLTAEAMLKANPDVILVMKEGADTVGGVDGVLGLPGIADTSAGRNRRVVQMDQTKILAFGPDIGEVVGALAKAIYT